MRVVQQKGLGDLCAISFCHARIETWTRSKNIGLGISLVLVGFVIRGVNMNLVQMFIDVAWVIVQNSFG